MDDFYVNIYRVSQKDIYNSTMGFNPLCWRYVNLSLLYRHFVGVSPCKQDQWKGGTMWYKQSLAMIVSVSVTVTVFACDVQWILFWQELLYVWYTMYIYILVFQKLKEYMNTTKDTNKYQENRTSTGFDDNILHVRFNLIWNGVWSMPWVQ